MKVVKHFLNGFKRLTELLVCYKKKAVNISVVLIKKSIYLAIYPLSNTSAVYALQTSLFDGYNLYIRPVKDQKTVTVVTLDLSLMQVISMVKYKHIFNLIIIHLELFDFFFN